MSGDKEKDRYAAQARTGKLMSVIRVVAVSDNDEQRNVEKSKLESAFQECDERLDKLISENYEILTKTIQAYSSISGRIKTSRERIKQVKGDLNSCKELLHCRRDELKKLWLEGIEQKQVLSLLDQIEEVKGAPQKMNQYIAEKRYLHATELLTKTVAHLEGDLKGVEALTEIGLEMKSRKETLFRTLLEELNSQLYEKSPKTFQTRFARGGSLRNSGQEVSPRLLQKQQLMDLAAGKRGSKRGYKRNFKIPETSAGVDDINKPITEELTGDPEQDVEHFIAILVESLALLKRIPDGTEFLKSTIQRELTTILHRTTSEVAQNAKQRGESITLQNQPKLLEELLDMLFETFQCIAAAHMTTLGSLQRISGVSESDFYSMEDVWSQIQNVLKVLLSGYLDMKNASSSVQQAETAFGEVSASDLGMYMSRRKPVRTHKMPLFQFEMSSHAISMTNYMREQKQEFYGEGGKLQTEDEGEEQMLCKPSIHNITVIFKPLNKFIKDIEFSMTLPEGQHCTLHDFVSDFIKDIFLRHLMAEIDIDLKKATKDGENMQNLVDGVTQKTLGAPCPILVSAARVDKAVGSLKQLISALPAYSDQLLNMVVKILKEYKDNCMAMYQGVVQPEPEDRCIISASWVKDDGINQCLRLLPNWKNLQEHRRAGRETTDNTPDTMEVVRERNEKESELLITNLGEKPPQKHEVLLEVSSLKLLDHLQESLEWFAGRIRTFAGQLPSQGFNTLTLPGSQPLDIPPVHPSLLHDLISLAKDFQNLSDTCLLVLHLEVRLHCFFYLLPVTKQSNFHIRVDDVEPDQNVLTLSKDLNGLEEALHSSLQPIKFKYIFEGLGHLISYLLINSTQHIKRINENGIKKMCRNIFILQQCLTNITMARETDLDQTRQYYELMYKNVDEIINSIVEQGAAFKEFDYRNIITLLHRSSPGFDQKAHNEQIRKLQEIMTEAV
ncbi:Exocyst complex component 4 [Holothuria leucospilota]|uniref:Exocyst complex component Sec8 n=1 Tax=Holothuria leucospilota TaxID=206669 RepID=A0A9Q0YSA7_HOLLE|nr:Exocyst complex component 4 [Holothuria leucospilota]